ncbi:class I SAM-dependent methyltransferase [Stenotrophomonas sp. YAU14A_MKIMI4_1]|uniref:class I SAM-dependent methyltransferase n=1 Tax=Stenotrophomonas sp. YAU14A_MKIMI4_1 TaxID=2072408 RepID=UPI000D53F437|nr:class I SAM-dependent methyltransferase [Stenotrophomonas sp. YAU14A_MKIMI4_1]AWH29584.1 methyltransferase type 11 [Stenotrophomonas sp. YAU14A_MKIMI4_1]
MNTDAPPVPAGYATSFLGDHQEGQLERLRTLERAFDPLSQAAIGQIDLGHSPSILDLGAGAGSFATWLIAQHPDAAVTATDIDTRFLTAIPGVRTLQHDVVTEDFPVGTFDLVHARALLCHLPQRHEVLVRAARWVKPGGWLLIEDVSVRPSLRTAQPVFGKVARAGLALLERSVGTDLLWADTLPSRLQAMGLSSVGYLSHEGNIGDGSAADAFWAATTAQAAPALLKLELVTEGDLNSMAELRASPDFSEPALNFVSAWGQVPLRESVQH